VEVVKIGVIKKRYITLVINLILIVSVLSGMFSRSELLSNSANYSNEIINNLLFNQIKNTPISKNLKNIDGFFTENQGQVDNESVRYYPLSTVKGRYSYLIHEQNLSHQSH